MKARWLVRCAWVTALTMAVPAAAQKSERYEISGTHVAVYDLVGEATLQAVSGHAVVVTVIRAGADAGQLHIAQGEIRDRQTLRIIYPADDIVYDREGFHGRSDVRVRDDGTFGDDHGDGWRGRRTRISGRGSGLHASADLRIGVPDGQRFDLYLAVGRVSVTNVHGTLRLATQSAPVRTSGTRGRLVVDVGSGRLNIADAQGDLDLDTGSGDVTVTTAQGDDVRVDTGSGSANLSGVRARTLSVDTGSGGIDLTDATADELRLDTGSGDVRMTVKNKPTFVHIDTGSGRVRATLPASYGARVDIETGSGGIDLDFPVTMTHWERDHIIGTIGDGSGRMEIDTGSGGVRLIKQ